MIDFAVKDELIVLVVKDELIGLAVHPIPLNDNLNELSSPT